MVELLICRCQCLHLLLCSSYHTEPTRIFITRASWSSHPKSHSQTENSRWDLLNKPSSHWSQKTPAGVNNKPCSNRTPPETKPIQTSLLILTLSFNSQNLNLLHFNFENPVYACILECLNHWLLLDDMCQTWWYTRPLTAVTSTVSLFTKRPVRNLALLHCSTLLYQFWMFWPFFPWVTVTVIISDVLTLFAVPSDEQNFSSPFAEIMIFLVNNTAKLPKMNILWLLLAVLSLSCHP